MVAMVAVVAMLAMLAMIKEPRQREMVDLKRETNPYRSRMTLRSCGTTPQML